MAAGFLLLMVAGFVGVNRGWTNTPGVVDRDFKPNDLSANLAWRESEEWQVLKEALTKDEDMIKRVSAETEIHPRLIMVQAAVEQLRLYTSDRGLFKGVFAPLKILGSQVQFSWGVVGIKQETAQAVEENLKNKTSPYYLGPKYENVLDFKTADQTEERFQRIIDDKNHYYSYLYTAFFLKQIVVQWERAGFDISDRPEILSTLYNIGFANSKPKIDPQVGGAAFDVNDKSYSFGRLAYEIYYSDELIEQFPR